MNMEMARKGIDDEDFGDGQREIATWLVARIEQLEGSLRYYRNQQTIGSPYGSDGLKGAIAHHKMYSDYFGRVLDGSQFSGGAADG